jgi:hypothetical protein
MIHPDRSGASADHPTPELLAGVYLDIEGPEDHTVRPCRPAAVVAQPLPDGTVPPTTDQLAGVYVEVETAEDLTVRPRPSVAPPRQS